MEPNETFTVNLSSAVNAVIGDAQGVGTITTDDVAQPPSITPGATTVSPGAPITFTVQHGPGNPADWVGFYAIGSGHGNHVHWVYLNNQQSAPTAGLTTATLLFTAPMAPGTYHARFFANNGWTVLATSPTITVP